MSPSVMGYSPESPRGMSPDEISPYLERPIRPLPKRRLRERLSPDVADSITYPPTPKSTTPLFYHPYALREDVGVNRLAESSHPSERERQEEMERGYITRKCGDELDSDEDDAAYRSRIYSRHSETTTGRSYRYVQKPDNKNHNPQAPASASSADSYDSFENTNNKKKRKIPTPGDSTLSGGHLSNDLAGMGISDDISEDVGNSTGVYNSPGSVSHGLSGPGRGRYGRVRNGRSPLRTLSDSNWGNGRNKQGESQGIISRSIANAHADKASITPAQGQENNSLLHQQASRKPSSTSTQFTFTCDSQVPSYPGPAPSTGNSHNSPSNHHKVSTQATQTSNMPGNLSTPQAIAQAKQGLAASQAQKELPAQPPPPVKKNRRRRTGKEYLIAARERRKDQEYKNYHHPPAAEDIWICEFCEYERIFGTPPEALIKQYEIKDRRLRKQEAERRRLLEKAKMKGRKGKKGNKGAVKTAPPPQDRQSSHAQTPAAPPLNEKQNHSQASHDSQGSRSHDSRGIESPLSDDYYPDGYNEDLDSQDEDYSQEDPPLPSPSPALERRGQIVHPDPGKHRQSSAAIPAS